MTTIIAKRNGDGSISLGWDSRASGDGEIYRVEKVSHVNQQFYIGVAGSVRYGNVIHHAEIPAVEPVVFESGLFNPESYLVNTVVPSWIDSLKERLGDIPKHREEWPDGGILVVLKGRMFFVDFDFAVLESAEDFLGIGSGSRYALGALKMGASVREALEVASEFDLYTGGAFQVLEGVE